MKKSNCPTCQIEIPFGLQRCFTCGTIIYWKDQGKVKVPVLRNNPLNFPQKAEIQVNGFGREHKDDSSPVVREYFPRERVIVIGMDGDYVALDNGGWIHFSTIGLFGKIYELTIIDPTGANTTVNVLDRPQLGPSPEESGSIMYTLPVGAKAQIWEVRPNWVRISPGSGHWLATYWLIPEDVAKL